MKRLSALLLALALLVVFSCLPAAADPSGGSAAYSIEVDITNQIVTVYERGTGAIVRQMICSTGTNDYTPTGEFVMPASRAGTDRKPWYKIDSVYVRYPARIHDEILFHSVPYRWRSLRGIDPNDLEKLGYPASHGCIRLRWQDAQFIAQNCLQGTPVKIYKSGQPDDMRRQLLMEETYDSSGGLSFERYFALTSEEGALGRFSQGQEVLNLQGRMRELGLYNGEVNGVYDRDTVEAVRQAQYRLGMDMSGVATEALQDRLYAQDAPTAMNATLSEGIGGSAVRRLQESLAALRLYEKEPDGVYDAATVEAVKRFQGAYGWTADGVAGPALQRAAAYEARQVAERFAGVDYRLTPTGDSIWMARVTASAGLIMRRSANQKSDGLKLLSQGDTVMILEKGKGWSLARSESTVGYVNNNFVDAYSSTILLLSYTGANGESYTIGNRASDYSAGKPQPCAMFAATSASRDQGAELARLTGYVTVDTRGEGLALNLRAEPDVYSAVLDEVEDGKSLKVLRCGEEWTQVSYRGQVGYLLNRYLNAWTGLEDASAQTAAFQAVVNSASGSKAVVYSDDADDAIQLGELSNGAQLDILDQTEGWCLVRYNGYEGYMLTEDLRPSRDAATVSVRFNGNDSPDQPVGDDLPT